jgi:hypothetical protein
MGRKSDPSFVAGLIWPEGSTRQLRRVEGRNPKSEGEQEAESGED